MDIALDYFIQIVFVLLVLSIVAEKIANFVKLRFPENRLKRLFVWKFNKQFYKDLSTYNDVQKHKRERELQTLTFLVGLTIAFGIRANIFEIWNYNYQLTWASVDPSTYGIGELGYDILGCALTGIFLSFGSKFFHDLLGLLMQTKNLKKKLQNREKIEEYGSVEEVDTYIKTIEPQVIEQQVDEYLKNSPVKVQRFEYSEVDDCVDVYLEEELTEEEEKQLEYFITVTSTSKNKKGLELNYFHI